VLVSVFEVPVVETVPSGLTAISAGFAVVSVFFFRGARGFFTLTSVLDFTIFDFSVVAV
jgi:hypothetical protein